MKPYSILYIFVVIFFNSLIIKAQDSDILFIKRNEKGIIRYARFNENKNPHRSMNNDTSFLKTILNAKNEDSFELIKEYTNILGYTHKRFQQYYKGLKVETAQYLVHGKNGYILSINGDFQVINIPIITPTISKQEAKSNALKISSEKIYSYSEIGLEDSLNISVNPKNFLISNGELVISKDQLSDISEYKLSWKFFISSLFPYFSHVIYVDANDGKVIKNSSLLYNSNVPATAQTLYSGTKTITCDNYYSAWTQLREVRNGVGIRTMSLSNTPDTTNPEDFTNWGTNWTEEDWESFEEDQWALDAHWNAEKVLDYWTTVFSRNSIDDNGLRLLNYVHYRESPLIPSHTAGWDNNPNRLWTVWADGDNTFNPLTALDISGHEYGHGITQFTSQLEHENNESGALNEGMSDIWGACVEHWAAANDPNKQTWLFGEEVFKPNTFLCVRNLENPKSPTSWNQGPDTYQGEYWDSIDYVPHVNSTVLSHWFYLLSEGGSGVNDKSHSYNVYGITIEAAQMIVYEANAQLSPEADYESMMEKSIDAAEEYGESSLEAMQVRNAWYAVGLGSQPTQMNISGSGLVCYSGTSYTLNNVPTGCTVSWNTSSNINLISVNGNAATFAATSADTSGYGWIQPVVYSNASGTYATGPKHEVWVGKPIFTSISGPNPPYIYKGCTGEEYTFWAYPSRDPNSQSSYTWMVQPGYLDYYFQYQYYDWATIVFNDPSDYYQVIARASNTCGSSSWVYKSVEIMECYFFSIYPNPASNYVTITLTLPDNIEEFEKPADYLVQIIDNSGITYYSASKTEDNFSIPVSSFKNGSYLVIIKYGNKLETLPLIVKH